MLKLTEGVTRADATLRDYVVTPALRTVSEESQSDLTLLAAENLLVQLRKDLKPEQTIRLGIGWIVQEESSNS